MKRALTLAIPLLLMLIGCDRQEEPLAIFVVLPAHGIAFKTVGLRLLDFANRKPRTPSGRRIVVNEVYVRGEEIANFVTTHSPVDIVICDSPDQLKKTPSLERELAAAVNVCGTQENCPAFIPSWVPSDRRRAAERVFQAIEGR